MIVVDASVAVGEALEGMAFGGFAGQDLVAPPLMWPEARSVLHTLVWRGEIEHERGEACRSALDEVPVERLEPPDLGREAWRIADDFGWAKTYDAEYVALARLLGCRLVTLDMRLRRRTDRLGFVVVPGEL